MASITVRNLDDDVKTKLRLQAARHGRSMEAEVREIIRRGIEDTQTNETVADLFARNFGPDNGFDLDPYLPERTPMREPPSFD